MTGGEPSSCKLTQRRLSRGWTHTSSFSLPASSLTNKPPSDEQRERPDRLFRLTGKTPLVLLPSMPDSLYQLCTMNCGRRQALSFLVWRERVTILRKEGIWRYKYHTQFTAAKRIEDPLCIMRQSYYTFPIVWAY